MSIMPVDEETEVAGPTRPLTRLRNATLESIQQDIKRTIGELEGHTRRLEDYLTALRATINEMSRGVG